MTTTKTRVSYHRLTVDARDTIRWSGVSIADYVRHFFPDGQWRGDRCGCTDDRCISYHHDERDDCHCLAVQVSDLVDERSGLPYSLDFTAVARERKEVTLT